MSAAFAMGAVAAPRALVEPPVPVDDPALSAVGALRSARADTARAYDTLATAIEAVRDAGAEILPRVQLSTLRDFENGELVFRPILARNHADIDALYSEQLSHAERFGRKALENCRARKAAHHAALDAEIERLRPIHEAAGYSTARDEVERCERHTTDTFIAAMTTEPRSPAGAYALWQLLAEELREYPDEGSSIFEGIDLVDKSLRSFLGIDEASSSFCGH